MVKKAGGRKRELFTTNIGYRAMRIAQQRYGTHSKQALPVRTKLMGTRSWKEDAGVEEEAGVRASARDKLAAKSFAGYMVNSHRCDSFTASKGTTSEVIPLERETPPFCPDP